VPDFEPGKNAKRSLKYLALRPFKPSNLPTRFHEDPIFC
jgi:hypothetical protein